MEEMNLLQETSWAEKAVKVQPLKPSLPDRFDLYRLAWLRRLIESPWPQFLARSVTLAGFVFAIAAGLAGSPVGSHNFAIIFVWIAWWSAFKLVFIPLGGRSWCSLCPIPLPGDWLQQGGILKKGRGLGLHWRWPRQLKGSWLQSGAFLLIGLFSALTLTDPRLTGWILLALFCLATGMSLFFRDRAFCSYVCPIGSFSGLYARIAPVEVRVIDPETCARHAEKTCYRACPWGLYPLALRDSSACGLCMECLRACPEDNLALNLRPFNADVGPTPRAFRLDDAFLALVMLGSALTFAAVFVGPWGELKAAAFRIGSWTWLGYLAGFLALSLLVLPGLFALAVWFSRRGEAGRQATLHEFARQSQALLPLGLFAWIAFTISFALPKLGTVLGVLNDPFGWGWKLLGAGFTAWQPDVAGFSPLAQALLLLVGLFWSARISRQVAGPESRRAVPLLAFSLVFTFAMLWLLVG